jgi:hypothetical protein
MWTKIDLFFTKALLFTLRALANFCLLALGLATCIIIRNEIFEYDEAFGDLSMLEFFVLVALNFLAWRHIYYARRLGMGFWSGLAKLLRGMGYLALSLSAATGIAIVTSIECGTGDISTEFSLYLAEDAVSKLLGYSVFLFGVYLSAPTGISPAIVVSPETTNTQEPT